jgi:hypothetical protein
MNNNNTYISAKHPTYLLLISATMHTFHYCAEYCAVQSRRSLTDVSEVLAASMSRTMKVMVALMMEAASTTEMSVNFYQTTRRNIPEDSHLHTRSVRT